jgi:ATP-dependent Lon protease
MAKSRKKPVHRTKTTAASKSARPTAATSKSSLVYQKETFQVPARLPLIPLRDVVVFPWMVYPLLVGRPASIEAVEEARRLSGREGTSLIFLAAQSDPEQEQPAPGDIFDVGVVARILQVVPLPNGMFKVVVEGMQRVVLSGIETPVQGPYHARGTLMSERGAALDARTEALMRAVVTQFAAYVDINRQIPEEVVAGVRVIHEPSRVADVVASHLSADNHDRQRLLTQADVGLRLQSVLELLASETQILELEQSIEGQVRDRMQNSQREYYLQEQMKAIREELGEGDEYAELDTLKEGVRKAGMPRAVRERAESEIEKLARMHTLSPEATVVRNYLDWLIELPWRKRTRDRLDLAEVRRILDDDHHALEKPKERILEYLAVLKMVGRIKGPILCLVGPPGTGKTSVAKSIAGALGRKFVRMSLGGVRDEAEIRGHRRTYIGALPGRIIQSMKKAGTRNPVFLLDEVDKVGADFRGDPAAALLEVLDPEQNSHFSDHYLEVEYDLSEVLFITTANTLYTIPAALHDRMETIEMPGYLEPDKLAIARDFLLPKQLETHGLKPGDILLSDRSLKAVIAGWTREAGVRNLERNLATLCRKVARQAAEAQENGKRFTLPVRITPGGLERYLGVTRYEENLSEVEDLVGAAQGLAWTASGGDLLKIEVALVPGKGKLQLTGKLGEVMKESAQAAYTFARAHAAEYGYRPDFYKDTDIHIHVPEGAIPKDGPSAGITIATALVSALSGRPVRRDLAMTGEITLRGHVLTIGGLNEKVMAARRSGIRTVILPAENERHLKEIPRGVAKGLTFIAVRTMPEVLAAALLPAPAPKSRTNTTRKQERHQKMSKPGSRPAAARRRKPGPPPAPRPGSGA